MATLEEALYGLNFTPAENPYGIAATQLGQITPKLINPYGSTGEAVGISLGSILLQSLLGYQARSQAAQETLQLNTLANQMQELTSAQARTDFITGVEDPMYQSRLSTLATALNAQERARKAKADEKLLEMNAGYEAQLGPKGTEVFEREQKAALAKILAAHPPKPAPVTFGPQEPIIKQGLFGQYETKANKTDRLIKEAANLGLPPGDRLDYASKNLKTEEAQTKAALTEVDKIRESINTADSMISRATGGISGAGETGGPAWLAGAREIASGLYSIAPTAGGRTERLQRAATKELDSIRPELVKQLRSPGAVSNYETEVLIGAGPSSANTPEENLVLLNNMVELNKLNSEYANFLETYVQDKGDAAGAKLLWDKYKKDQVIINNQINPNRQSWAEYFAEKQGGISGSSDVGTIMSRLQAVATNPAASEATKAAALAEINKLLGQ